MQSRNQTLRQTGILPGVESEDLADPRQDMEVKRSHLFVRSAFKRGGSFLSEIRISERLGGSILFWTHPLARAEQSESAERLQPHAQSVVSPIVQAQARTILEPPCALHVPENDLKPVVIRIELDRHRPARVVLYRPRHFDPVVEGFEINFALERVSEGAAKHVRESHNLFEEMRPGSKRYNRNGREFLINEAQCDVALGELAQPGILI